MVLGSSSGWVATTGNIEAPGSDHNLWETRNHGQEAWKLFRQCSRGCCCWFCFPFYMLIGINNGLSRSWGLRYMEISLSLGSGSVCALEKKSLKFVFTLELNKCSKDFMI